MDKTPIYPHSAAYARENGELAQYRASLRAFSACKSAIDSTIRSHWDGMNFPKGCAKKVLEQFGPDQVSFILAYTVHERNFDNRFSGHNASWADTISTFGMGHGLESCTLESHPAKVDLFIDLVRSDLQELAKQKSTERQARSADHGKKVFKLDKTPIYKETFAYAYEHGEAEQHRASLRANIACKDAIVMAINDNYRENRLNTAAAVKEVVQQFGFERMFYVLANTLQTMDSDGRISQANKQWAQSVPVVFEQGKRDMTYLITQSHPGLLNMFANEARHEHLLRQPLKAADIKAEAEHIMQRLQSEQEPNSPNGTIMNRGVSTIPASACPLTRYWPATSATRSWGMRCSRKPASLTWTMPIPTPPMPVSMPLPMADCGSVWFGASAVCECWAAN